MSWRASFALLAVYALGVFISFAWIEQRQIKIEEYEAALQEKEATLQEKAAEIDHLHNMLSSCIRAYRKEKERADSCEDWHSI